MKNGLGAIILAAGLSRRMGTPKMLLPWGQTTIRGQVISIYTQAGIDEIVIVTGGAREAVEIEVKRLSEDKPLRCVFNPLHETGEMLSSLQCGLRSLERQFNATLIGLGDQPQISLEAVRQVILAYQKSSAKLIVPSFGMRRGHPWLMKIELWQDILMLTPPSTLRDFLNMNADEIIYVETDQTILKDLDTPDEYQREKP